MTTIVKLLFACCLVKIAIARSDAEMKKWFVEQAVECSKEHPVTGEEFAMMKEHKIPNNNNAKCILACIFKKIGWVDEKGIFNVDNALATSQKEYPDDQAKIENAKKLYEICKKVNDESLPNDKDGCERSTLLATCFIEQAPKMGFFLQK